MVFSSISIDNSNNQKCSSRKKQKRNRPKVGDPDFKPPDGGWGWLIVFMCGFGNLCSFPMFHQFGLVFKEKFELVGINSSQTLTILNLCVAFNTGIGLVNGPLFSLFSQRQVALCSSFGVVISLLILSFCKSFWAHIIMYSFCFGASFGLLEAANSLAINTYFEEKRRTATGYSWTLTALGPIVCPYIIVYLESIYGINGVIMFFSAFAMHSIACSLFLQPVEWHTKIREPTDQSAAKEDVKDIFKNPAVPSHFFENEAYCNSHPSTPSLNPKFVQNSTHPVNNELLNSSLEKYIEPNEQNEDTEIARSDVENIDHQSSKSTDDSLELPVDEKQIYADEPRICAVTDKSVTIWKKIYQYFDFDLLKDLTYVNLNLGLTFANITEMNFSLGTPLILAEFNFSKIDTANFMSILAASDIVFRLISSLVADKIGWSNKTYFLLGVLSMALGRVILVHTQSFQIGIGVAVLIGIGKALRAIFMVLVIPSHVPLERLPAAYGLQFAVSGVTFLIFGPIIGWIRDYFGTYVITLHILNIFTYLTAISWTINSFIRRNKKKSDTQL